MTRRILLLDVTAMADDAVCVAGMDLKSGDHVRLHEPQPTRKMIKKWNINPGDTIRVDCKPVQRAAAPHREDYRWNERSLRKEGAMPFADVLDLVGRTAFPSIHDAFGDATSKGSGRNSAWTPGQGRRSLATLSVRTVRAERDHAGKVRIMLRDDQNMLFGAIPFQDLLVRDHERACPDCRDGYLEQIKSEFDADRAVVRIGLTRPFQAHADDAPVCWLQVTNILARPRTHFQSGTDAQGAVRDAPFVDEGGILSQLRSAVRRLYRN